MHVLRRQTQTAHTPWKSEKISQSKTEILQKSTGTQKGTAKPRNWQAKPAVAGSLPASSGGGSGNWQAKPAVPGSPPASSSEGAGKSVVADRDCCEMGVQTDMQLLCQAHEPMVQANMTQQATYMWAPPEEDGQSTLHPFNPPVAVTTSPPVAVDTGSHSLRPQLR